MHQDGDRETYTLRAEQSPVTDVRRRETRAVFAGGILAGLAYLATTLAFRPAQVGIASDVYYHAGRAALVGGDIYAVTPPDHPGYRYLYPPAVVVVFLPHALLKSELAALALQTLLNVIAVAGTLGAVIRGLERRGLSVTLADTALLGGFLLGSIHWLPSFVMGQVTPWLAFGIAAGTEALDRGHGRSAGILFAAAAFVKLFPATVGAWLLRRRSWVAVATALGAGVVGLVSGAAVFGPVLTVRYLTVVVPGELQTQTFVGTPDPGRSFTTARRQVAALVPGLPRAFLSPTTAAVLSLPLTVLYARVETDLDRLSVLLGTLVATLLFLPLEPLYFPLLTYPLVILLYRLPAGRPRSVLLAGTLGTYVTVTLADVTLAVAAAPLPPAVASALVMSVRTVFSVIQPATVGMWLLLLGCVLSVRSE